MAKLCFSIICMAEIEEKLLDVMLTSFPDDVFTSLPIFSHGTLPGQMSAIEQVIGRSGSVCVQILVSAEESDTLQALLRRDFAGTGIRFWATPMVVDGEIA
jgi:hypothetical protein